MSQKRLKKIIELVRQAQKEAYAIDIPNILQPGLVKEMVIAELLGHQLIHAKRDSDACDPKRPSVKYEYLTCNEGGTGQFDRMFKSPKHKHEASLLRITRNTKVYLAIFKKDEALKVKTIYELDPKDVLIKAKGKLKRSKNSISHVGFSESWAKQKGKVVYPKK